MKNDYEGHHPPQALTAIQGPFLPATKPDS